jgi:hypothetical protein
MECYEQETCSRGRKEKALRGSKLFSHSYFFSVSDACEPSSPRVFEGTLSATRHRNLRLISKTLIGNLCDALRLTRVLRRGVGLLLRSVKNRVIADPRVPYSPSGSSRPPAGIIASRPLRVRCGMGLPHFLQNAVAKLRAWRRSKRATDCSSRSHRSAGGFHDHRQECAVLVASRQREQWQFRTRSNGPSTSNATSPQMQLPGTL